MKIAITSTGKDLSSSVDSRFGRARYFIIYDTETGEWKAYDNSTNMNAAQGAGIQSAQNVIDHGAEAVITGRCGPKAFKTLKAGDVKIFCADGLVKDAIENFKNNKLEVCKENI